MLTNRFLINSLRSTSSMDPSIFKLEDEGESMHFGDDLDASQAALIRDTEGENHSSSQQFATRNDGSGGGYANGDHHRQHILESIEMKEQQLFVLGNENQEFKHENESHLKYNPLQDHCQLWENPSHVPQASDLKSINNSVCNDSERPQQVRGPTPAQLCGLLNILKDQQLGKNREMQLLTLFHKLKRKEITETQFVRHMLAVVDDKQTIRLVLSKLQGGNMKIKVPGPPNHNKVSSASTEISAQESDPRGVHVNQLPSTTSGTLSTSATVQGLNKHPQQHMELPSSCFQIDTDSGSLNPYPGTNVTSPGSLSRAKLHEIQRMQMANNQSVGSTSVGGPTKSTINTKTAPNFERLTSVNGPSRFQGGNLSLPLYPDPCQGPVTKDQTVGPSSSVVHVKQKWIDQSFDQAQKPRSLVQQGVTNVPLKQNNTIPSSSNDDVEMQSSKMVLSTSTTHGSSVPPSMTTQLDSSKMVNFPAPSGTIPERANVKTTPEMPSVGQKKPLEAVGSTLPPLSKKQKLCGDSSSDQSINRLNDVTAVSGIDLREEEKRLLDSGPKKDSRLSKESRRVVHEEELRMILQKIPLQRKLTEIMAKSGLKHIDHDVEQCLSVCVEERMRGLLSNIIRISKQRTDTEKSRNRICITSDIRKQINEMNQKVKEEWERKHGGEEKNEETDTEKEDNRFKKVKAKNKEEEMRAKAANVAALVAAGGDDKFFKWKLMAEARQKSSSGPEKKSKKLSHETGGTRYGKNQGLPKVVRSISVKDVIAVVEKEPQMSRSTLLYRLCNRIC